MADFLNNVWVVGVGTSVVSGIVVYIVTSRLTKWLGTNRESREYLQSIKVANNEILYSIRPLIAQQTIPFSKMTQSIIQAAARKYEVRPEDLFDLSVLEQELMKEISDNTFLTPEQKIALCHKLEDLHEVQSPIISSDVLEPNLKQAEKRVSYFEMLFPIVLSIVAVATTVLVALDKNIGLDERISSSPLFPAGIAVMTSILALLAAGVFAGIPKYPGLINFLGGAKEPKEANHDR